MNIFGWLLLVVVASVLLWLSFSAVVIAIDMRAARRRKALQSPHDGFFFGQVARGKWRVWRRHSRDEMRPAGAGHSFVGTRAPIQKAVDAALGESIIGELPGDLTLIGTLVLIKGLLLSREDVYLNGQMEGTVEVPECRLTIGPEGRLQANVRAREIVVHGTIHGTVEAGEKIDIRQDAKLVCDIKSGRIIIEDGAYLKGSVDMPIRETPKGDEAYNVRVTQKATQKAQE
jgi:cytoskeletal protein CcmA (bactofilin family)